MANLADEAMECGCFTALAILILLIIICSSGVNSSTRKEQENFVRTQYASYLIKKDEVTTLDLPIEFIGKINTTNVTISLNPETKDTFKITGTGMEIAKIIHGLYKSYLD